MVRKIYYTVAKDGNSISPSKMMFGGMQYEDNATVISFMIDPDMTGEDMIWRIDFDSAEAGYDPGEGIQGSVVFERPLPYKFTRFGGDVQATLVGTKVDENLEPVKVIYSIPVFVYLKKVDKHEETDDITALNVSASEAKAAASAQAAKKAEENAAASASSAEDAMEQTLAAKKVLEEDSVFVFRGGGADGGGVVELIVEDFLSETSTNPPTNRAVALKLQEHDYLILSNAANLKSLEELIDSLGTSVSENRNDINRAKLEAHPIGSLLLTANDTNPAATLGGTWIIERCLYGGELLAAGQIYNGTALNRVYDANTLVSAVAIFETADNKTVYIQNNLKDTLSLESGVFKVKTSGVVGVVDVDYYVSGHLGANIGSLWFSTQPGSSLPDTVGTVQNGGLMGTLNSNAGYGGTSAKYQYYVSENDAGTEFLINPQFVPYGGSFTPCGGGAACGMYVRVYAKGSTRYVWKRTK